MRDSRTTNGVPKNVQVGGIRGINNVPDYVKLVDNLITNPIGFRRLLENSSCSKTLTYAKEQIKSKITNSDDRLLMLGIIKAKSTGVG